MIFGFICTIVLSFFYLFTIEEFGSMYIDTYIMIWFGIAIFGWIISGIPELKLGFLVISLLSIFTFSFWFTKNPKFPRNWRTENLSVVEYHQRYHITRTTPSTSSSSSSSSSSGSYSYSSGSSYGGRSYSGGGFSGGK